MTTVDYQTPPAGGGGANLPGPGEEIVARAGRYYRNTRFIMTVVLLGMAGWFAYDGYVAWPRDNEIHRLHRQDPVKHPQNAQPHSDTDIWFQKVLAGSLPVLALGLLGWTLYNSRGAYRLKDDVLRVPGHPDVPLDAITKIDKSKWDRKGIAYLEYEVAGGGGGARKGTLKLDDFVYERPPTDRILETIEAKLLPPAATEVKEGEPRGFDVVPAEEGDASAGGRGPE